MTEPTPTPARITAAQMSLEPHPTYGWQWTYPSAVAGKPKNAYLTEAVLAQFVRLAVVRVGAPMDDDQREAFLQDVKKMLAPPARRRKGAVPEPDNGAAPSASALAAAKAAGK
jgi:hypothetical protein